MQQLSDFIELDGVTPEAVRDCIVENVNLGMAHDGRANLPAHFVGWLVQENDRLRAALAAAQAEGAKPFNAAAAQRRIDYARDEGFAAGIEAALGWIKQYLPHLYRTISDGFSALRPPAAPAGKKDIADYLEQFDKSPYHYPAQYAEPAPPSASAPAGAPNEVRIREALYDLVDWVKDGCAEEGYLLVMTEAQAALKQLALLRQSGTPCG